MSLSLLDSSIYGDFDDIWILEKACIIHITLPTVIFWVF